MANEIQIRKTVNSKEEFEKVIDTSFKIFVDPTVKVNTDTVEELFRMYSKLYYEIAVDGDVNSHSFLIKESSKLVNFEKDLSEIQPLLDEISELRERLLEANIRMIELQTQSIQNAAN